MTDDILVVTAEDVTDDLEEFLADDEAVARSNLPRGVERALASWAEEIKAPARRDKGLWTRDKYVTPTKILEQMALSYDVSDDDIVSQFMDTSEAMAFQKMQFESDGSDEEDVWNQVAADLNLDQWVRQAWRELILVSQYYGIKLMGVKTYRVRGKGEGGRERRKEFTLRVPIGLGFLDPTRVVPVNLDPFGNYDLAWIATEDENKMFKDVNEGVQTDEVISQVFMGRYETNPKEAKDLQKEGVDVDNLWTLNPELTWKHTLTKSPYERWSWVRMKSMFPLLDLKHQLREMDRAFLLGGINFLVLVKRGSDSIPAQQSEVQDTAFQIRNQSKTPIIISDHRLEIEIITPNLDSILSEDKWKVVDDRIMLRLFGGFDVGQSTQTSDTSLTRGRVVARGFSSRRHMIKRDLERNVIVPVQELNEDFDVTTKIEFSPRRIELDFDATLAQFDLQLRDRGDLSRETLLAEFGFDQDTEAQRREIEDKEYGDGSKPGDRFAPTNVPFDSPEKTTPDGSGRTGGRPKTKPQEKAK